MWSWMFLFLPSRVDQPGLDYHPQPRVMMSGPRTTSHTCRLEAGVLSMLQGVEDALPTVPRTSPCPILLRPLRLITCTPSGRKVDNSTGYGAVTGVRAKGATDKFVIYFCARTLDEMGYHDIVLQADGEHSLLDQPWFLDEFLLFRGQDREGRIVHSVSSARFDVLFRREVCQRQRGDKCGHGCFCSYLRESTSQDSTTTPNPE